MLHGPASFCFILPLQYIPPLLLWLQNTFETYLFCCRFSHRFTSAVSFLAQYTVSRFSLFSRKSQSLSIALSLSCCLYTITLITAHTLSHTALSVSLARYSALLSLYLSLSSSQFIQFVCKAPRLQGPTLSSEHVHNV